MLSSSLFSSHWRLWGWGGKAGELLLSLPRALRNLFIPLPLRLRKNHLYLR